MPNSIAKDGMATTLAWCASLFQPNTVSPYFIEEVRAEFRALVSRFQSQETA